MTREISKSDWKHFKVVREAALQRLCERILKEVSDIANDESKTFHDRHLAAYKAIKDGDKKVADGFNFLSRSRMAMQLGYLNAQGLLEDTEIANFSGDLQEYLKSMMDF